MPGLRFSVVDPLTGERIELSVTNRKGKLVIERLADHITGKELTPRRAEHMASFGEVVAHTKGSQMTEALPPGAIAIERDLPERAQNYKNPRRSQHKARADYYKGLIGMRDLALASQALDVKEVPTIEREALPPKRQAREVRVPERVVYVLPS